MSKRIVDRFPVGLLLRGQALVQNPTMDIKSPGRTISEWEYFKGVVKNVAFMTVLLVSFELLFEKGA